MLSTIPLISSYLHCKYLFVHIDYIVEKIVTKHLMLPSVLDRCRSQWIEMRSVH